MYGISLQVPFKECFTAREAPRLDPKMTDYELFERHYLDPNSKDGLSSLSKTDMFEDAAWNT